MTVVSYLFMSLWLRNLGRVWLAALLLHVVLIGVFHAAASKWTGLENSKRLHLFCSLKCRHVSAPPPGLSLSTKLRLPPSMVGSGYFHMVPSKREPSKRGQSRSKLSQGPVLKATQRHFCHISLGKARDKGSLKSDEGLETASDGRSRIVATF